MKPKEYDASVEIAAVEEQCKKIVGFILACDLDFDCDRFMHTLRDMHEAEARVIGKAFLLLDDLQEEKRKAKWGISTRQKKEELTG